MKKQTAREMRRAGIWHYLQRFPDIRARVASGEITAYCGEREARDRWIKGKEQRKADRERQKLERAQLAEAWVRAQRR